MFFLAMAGFVRNNMNAYTDQITVSKLQVDAKDLCIYLSSNTGSPYYWEQDINGSTSIGLKNLGNNSLNISKFYYMNSTNYFTILNKLGESDFINVQIEDLNNGSQYLNFGVSPGYDSYRGTATCYTRVNGREAKMAVVVWR